MGGGRGGFSQGQDTATADGHCKRALGRSRWVSLAVFPSIATCDGTRVAKRTAGRRYKRRDPAQVELRRQCGSGQLPSRFPETTGVTFWVSRHRRPCSSPFGTLWL